MDTQIIEVSLPEALIRQIDALARTQGNNDRDGCIRQLIEKGLQVLETPHAQMSFSELLARAAGPSPADAMTEEELTEFAEGEVKAYRAEKRQAARNE